MHSQLTHIMTQQHHADLLRAAERRRLVAEARPPRLTRRPAAALTRLRGRVASAVVSAAAGTTRNAL